MGYFSFSISEDQPAEIAAGYICLEKNSDNFKVWQGLKRNDIVFIAPISVPFKVYILEVLTLGVSENTAAIDYIGGLLIYFRSISENRKVKTNLYNIQIFAKPTSVEEQIARELIASTPDASKVQFRRDPVDVLPIVLPNEYQMDIALDPADNEFLERCLKLHPFSFVSDGLRLVTRHKGDPIGGAIIRINSLSRNFHRAESHIFGDALNYIRDESVHISRILSKYKGARRHIVFEKVITGVLFLSRHLFQRPTTYVSGVSYDLIPAAFRVGARITVPQNPNEALFYWKSFLPESKPLTRLEYESIKDHFREATRQRRASSSWAIFSSEANIKVGIANKLWLLSEGRGQTAKWRSVRAGDKIYLSKPNANLVATAIVEKTGRRTVRGYEQFPLAIEFSAVAMIDSRTSASISDMTRWLLGEHQGGISSVPIDIALEIENHFSNQIGGSSMWVNPNPFLFRGTDFVVRRKQLFVVQSWALRESVLPSIRVVCERNGYTVTHSDDRDGQVIFQPVWKLMNEAEAVIVDFSNQRPNVFLEFGMALVLGKPIVAITQSESDIPSDTPNLKWHLYRENAALIDLEKILPRAISDTIAEINALNAVAHAGART